jgi:hypothetical protein
MKIGFLGDFKDHWKGSVHHFLAKDKSIRKLKVLPMLTDPGRWTDDHYKAYARLLRVPAHSILRCGLRYHGSASIESVSAYFRCARDWAPPDSDLFIDPNVGIRKVPANKKKRDKYVLVADLAHLLPPKSDRLVMVYDESRDNKNLKGDHILDLGRAISSRGLSWCAYESGGNLTMFFISRKANRRNRVRHHLGTLLGPCAEGDCRPGGPNRLFVGKC